MAKETVKSAKLKLEFKVTLGEDGKGKNQVQDTAKAEQRCRN